MPYDQHPKRLHKFCEGIISKDSSIRFAGVANRMGKLIEAAYREGLLPLMDRQETEHYSIQTVLRASTRETFENKIGKQRYALAVYEKLIRATIPIVMIGDNDDDDNNNNDEEEERRQQPEEEEQDLKWLYLLISFDIGSDVISIVEDKILPHIEQSGKGS